MYSFFRDTVYVQNTGTVHIVRLYTAAKQDIEKCIFQRGFIPGVFPLCYLKALNLHSQNIAARYVIAAKYIQAPWPVGNLKKGAKLLEEITMQNISSLEKEDIFNIYLAMAVVCQKEKKKEEFGMWYDRTLALYPTNKFMETLFNIRKI